MTIRLWEVLWWRLSNSRSAASVESTCMRCGAWSLSSGDHVVQSVERTFQNSELDNNAQLKSTLDAAMQQLTWSSSRFIFWTTFPASLEDVMLHLLSKVAAGSCDTANQYDRSARTCADKQTHIGFDLLPPQLLSLSPCWGGGALYPRGAMRWTMAATCDHAEVRVCR
eukprot:3864624-Amphidinium_carterae.1